MKHDTHNTQGDTMNTDTTFNGWANRETWCLALHLNSTEWMQDAAHALAFVPDSLEEWVTCVAEMIFYPAPGDPYISRDMRAMIKDVGSLYRVEWAEIEEHFLDSAREIDDHQQED